MTEQASQADQTGAPSLSPGTALRQRAEELWAQAAQTSEANELLSPVAVQQMLHELQVHQIELEMQNEELRQTQTKLEAAQARYFDLYDLAPVGYFTLSEHGLIWEVNLTAVSWLGVTRSTLAKQPFSRYILTADQDTYYRHRRQLVATGAPQVWEMSMRRPDGSSFWVQADATVVQDEGHGAPLCRIVISSIAARKQAEAVAQEQRRFAEVLRDSLAALTSSLDVGSVMQRLLDYAAIVVPSEAGCIILFEGNYGHVAYLRGFPSEAQTFFKDYRFPTSALAQGQALADKQGYFVPDTHADPTWITLPVSAWIRSSMGTPIERRGEIIGLLVVDSATPHHFGPPDMEKLQIFAHYASLALENAYHMTELEVRVVERTKELQATKEQVETILNNSPDSILLVQPDLSIQRTNAAFNTLFGYGSTNDCVPSLNDLLHPDDAGRVNTVVQTVLQKQISQQIETRCYRKNGLLFDAELNIGPSQAVGLVLTLRDITERKQNEQRLYAALAKEKELSELKSRFVSMASHEFRTPLASILALTETLSAYWHKLTTDQIMQRLDRVKEQVGYLKNIMEDVLNLARLQARQAEFNPILLDLDELCRSILDELQGGAAVTHPIVYNCTAHVGLVALDKKLLRQVISNLVSNAIKYSEATKPVHISLASTGEALVFQVRDEGIGIPAADLPHLFEPFHRGANVGTIAGTGLGLTITKEAVELHGGAITVESQVGVGTNFTVRLPVVTRTPQ